MRTLSSLLATVLTLSATTQAQLRGVPVENIDRSANPCQDFDVYANGQWRATHPMPAIQAAWAIRVITQEETRARLRAIAEEDAGKTASLPKGSPGQLTGDFYAGCMDETHINSLGLKPLEPLWKRIDSVHDAKSLSAEIVRLQQIDVQAPVELDAAQDLHDPAHMIAEIEIAGMGLPDRDYYLRNEPRFKDAREKYISYARRMFVLSGMNDGEALRASAAILNVETSLAQPRMTRVALRDPKLHDHPMSIAELKALAPHFD